MTIETDGDEKSKTVNQLLDDALKVLDEYNNKNLINSIQCPSEVEVYLSYDTDNLERLGPDECGNGAYILSRYALFIQKEVNRESAKLKWAEHNLEISIGKLASQYGDKYTKFEQKKALVIGDNQYAKVLNKIVLEASLRIHDLNMLANRIHHLGTTLLELQQTRRRK